MNLPIDKQIICMDYDGVLSKTMCQLLDYYLISMKKTFYVITKQSPNEDIYITTDNIGIPRENVIFTSNGPKSLYIKQYKIELFYDDKQENLDEINKNAPNCQTILVK